MQYPYQDTSLSFEERAKDLVSRMTLEEKASQTVFNAPAIERLGIPAYNWWNEALHGVARAGTATVFPQAIALAATFDEDLIDCVAQAISDEGRAKYHMQVKKGDRDIYKGLTFWSPNVNIFRDPRWGRGHETYGEDPYLTSRLGIRFIHGLQGDGHYLKSAACAKHFAVHSGPEDVRHSFDAQVNQRDLWETYLPAFKACVQEAGVEAVMGAYNRTNGEPCCGSKTLLADILRGQWGFSGHVTSDCWALVDFHKHHGVTSTALESVALAMNNGCDLNCGNMYLNLLLAHQEGLISEETITQSVVRLMTTRMKLGMFDDDQQVPYASIPYTVVDCKEHAQLNEQTARKSLVLLKNNGLLPLCADKIRSIGVIGPNANNRRALVGNYEGTASRYVTVLEGIQDHLAGSGIDVRYAQGCHLFRDSDQNLGKSGINDRLSEALAVAEMSDVVVLCMGLDPGLEGEQGDEGNEFASGDKPTLDLPGMQKTLVEQVLSVGKPTVLISLSGSALILSEKPDAVVQAFYPGALGGRAVASLLFGEFSPEGKLPVTFYRTTQELPDFEDYAMDGRTYRYMKEEALYPFGFGLSFTSFAFTDLNMEPGREAGSMACSVTVTNTGDRRGAQTVQTYIRAHAPHAPNHQLKKLVKVELDAGEARKVEFTLMREDFCLYNDDGVLTLPEGDFEVFVGASQPDTRSVALMGAEPLRMVVKNAQLA